MSQTLLLTSFEAFGGRHKNASEQALLAIQLTPPAGLKLEAHRLPVVMREASQHIRALLDDIQPDLWLALGEAKRDALTLEEFAYNEWRFTIPDNAGQLATGEPIDTSGVESYGATLPLEVMLSAMLETHIPARLSQDAGRYLCNEVYYSGLQHIHKQGFDTRAVFIHVPHLPEAASTPEDPSLPTADVVRGILAAVQSLH